MQGGTPAELKTWDNVALQNYNIVFVSSPLLDCSYYTTVIQCKNQDLSLGWKMATLEQQLAQAEAKVARLKEKAKKQDTAEKVVIGGMMLAYARKSPNNAKRLLEIMQSELREQDLKRVQRAMGELDLIVGNEELSRANLV